jgi:hypothetical protein
VIAPNAGQQTFTVRGFSTRTMGHFTHATSSPNETYNVSVHMRGIEQNAFRTWRIRIGL